MIRSLWPIQIACFLLWSLARLLIDSGFFSGSNEFSSNTLDAQTPTQLSSHEINNNQNSSIFSQDSLFSDPRTVSGSSASSAPFASHASPAPSTSSPPVPPSKLAENQNIQPQDQYGTQPLQNKEREIPDDFPASTGISTHNNTQFVVNQTKPNPPPTISSDLIDFDEPNNLPENESRPQLNESVPLNNSGLLDSDDVETSKGSSPLDSGLTKTAVSKTTDIPVIEPPPTSNTTPRVPGYEANQEEWKRSEVYEIRIANWTDGTTDLRQSPILVQNENGPCPLLALVNSLVMRSAPDAPSPLIRALLDRERISLGLLIQALFDELTSYIDGQGPLPDIEDLSAFLTMLHTGMNVNPRLTPVCPFF